MTEVREEKQSSAHKKEWKLDLRVVLRDFRTFLAQGVCKCELLPRPRTAFTRLLKAVKLWSSLLIVGKCTAQCNRCNEVMGWYVVSHPKVPITLGKGRGQDLPCVWQQPDTHLCCWCHQCSQGREQVPR